MDAERKELTPKQEEKFEKLYKEMYPVVLRYLKTVVQENDWVEDVVQETFWLAYNKFDELEEHLNIRGWLMKTAKYKLQNMQRKMREWEHMSIDENDMEFFSEERDYQLPEIESVLEVLNPKEREFFRQYILLDYSVKEMAQLHCTTENNMRVKLYRLAKKWKKNINLMLFVLLVGDILRMMNL